jgi:hypothetical protein
MDWAAHSTHVCRKHMGHWRRRRAQERRGRSARGSSGARRTALRVGHGVRKSQKMVMSWSSNHGRTWRQEFFRALVRRFGSRT